MQQHFSMDTMLAYLDDAEHADFNDLRLHLAACKDCRSAIMRLSMLQNTIRTAGPYRNSLDAASESLRAGLQAQSIERYVDGALRGPETAAVKQLLQSDPLALKAALHYASHSAAAARATLASPQTATAKYPLGKTGLQSIVMRLRTLLAFRPPVWISVPATAAAVLLMTWAIIPGQPVSQDGGITVAAYQDKPVIHFQNAGQLPGIGFFSKALRSAEPYGPLEIRYNEPQTLSLRWPEVPNAAAYRLSVFLIGEGQKITLRELQVKENRADITAFKAEPGKRYEWTLTGETTQQKSFYASGGFVIDQRQ